MRALRRLRWRAAALALAGTMLVATTAAADTNLGETGGFTYITDETATDGPQTIDAACPEETQVFGGGFEGGGYAVTENGPFDGSDLDRRPDDGWRASRTVSGGFGFEVFAICSVPPPAYERDSLALLDGQFKTVKVPCPDGTRVSGGGGRVDPGLAIRGSYPYDGRDRNSRPDDGWAIRAFAADGPGHAVARAICVEDHPSYIVREGPVPATGFTTGIADCPAALHVVGMGGRSSSPGTEFGLIQASPGDSAAGANTDADSIPDDRSLFGFSNSSGEEESLRAFAVCMADTAA
jgi:hypothetical protein